MNKRPYDPNTDGCTAWPDFDYKECCAEHDFYYVNDVGVTTREADAILRDCIRSKGGWHKIMGWLVWIGVRVYSKNVRGRKEFEWLQKVL